ncbi:MAG TPA: hypothetical protein VMZ53_30500 [Kofleriaceae bacterium]|nr:hypothetical protein [Kofleriaceae bacterium]
MVRVVILALVAFTATAHAQNAFDVCKGESKPLVEGKGKITIAVVYPEDFPVKTTPAMRNAVGAALAKAEKGTIVPAKDVEAAKKLVDAKKWTDKSDACGYSPSLVAVLGQKHKNLSTAHATVACSDDKTCTLRVDLERHGKPTAERWVRYEARLPKTDLATIQKTAAKLASKGAPPDAPTKGLAVKELTSGAVTVRSDIDGALELDAAMEANAAFAACAPKKKSTKDIRGYWADWKLNAKGTAMEVFVKPFGGVDPTDETASKCLRDALQKMQMACPRDGQILKVRTAICL